MCQRFLRTTDQTKHTPNGDKAEQNEKKKTEMKRAKLTKYRRQFFFDAKKKKAILLNDVLGFFTKQVHEKKMTKKIQIKDSSTFIL